MPRKSQKLPKTLANLRIRGAVQELKKMSMADRIQLMVKAKLMTQAVADQTKLKLANGDNDHR